MWESITAEKIQKHHQQVDEQGSRDTGSPLLNLLTLSCTLKAVSTKGPARLPAGFLGETDKADPKPDSQAANWGQPDTLQQ